jgi:hypothetical protein
VLQQWHGPLTARAASLNEELSDQPKNYRFFFADVIVGVAEFSQCDEYHTKYGENANTQHYEYLI